MDKGMRNGKRCWLLLAVVLILVLFLCGCVAKQQTAQSVQEDDTVFVVYGNAVTTGGEYWSNRCGAITASGKMVLPIDERQIEILYDGITKKQCYLQTRRIKVTDLSRSLDELQNDYMDGLYGNQPWQYFEGQYGLYDLDGTRLQEDGPRAVQAVFGDVVWYNDGKLENQKTGQVYFDDVSSVTYADGHYIIGDKAETRVRIADESLQVQKELPGSGYVTNGCLLLWQDWNMGQGLYTLDGEELLPCEYDNIRPIKNSTLCIVDRKQPSDSFVMDLADGTVRYTTPTEGQRIQYADDKCVLIFSILPDGNETYQIVRYDGVAVSKIYSVFLRCMNEGEPNPVFGDYGSILVDQDGKELYTVPDDQWLSWVGPNRIVVEKDGVAHLQDLEDNVKSKKDYIGIYAEYALTEDGSDNSRVSYVTGYYRYHNLQLYDLMDLDGNLLIEQAKFIDVLSPNRFWVEQGFSQGLMDETGAWIYQQSLFTSPTEE